MDQSHGELLGATGVTGPAAKMGHRLTIEMGSWRARLRFDADRPAEVDVTVDVDSLQVLRGEGGLKGLSGPEKVLARSNALGTLDAKRHPHIRFHADDIDAIDDGYRLAGTLEIHGTAREQTVDVHVADLGDTWRMSCEVPVRQSVFGVKPYSMMMGAMKVVDDVTVTFGADRVKD